MMQIQQVIYLCNLYYLYNLSVRTPMKREGPLIKTNKSYCLDSLDYTIWYCFEGTEVPMEKCPQ